MIKYCKEISFVIIIMDNLFISLVNSYDTGPPIKDETCSDMIPNHIPSVSLDNIDFSHSEDLCYNPGRLVKASIFKAGSEKVGNIFNGIMIQAKAPGVSNNNFGSFDIKDSRKLKVSDCFLKLKSTLHHITKLNQSNLTFYWIPPLEDEGDLEFDLTIVFTYENFITGLKIPIPVCSNTTTTSGSTGHDVKMTHLPTMFKSHDLPENTPSLTTSLTTTADLTTATSTFSFEATTEALTTRTTKSPAPSLTLRGSNTDVAKPLAWLHWLLGAWQLIH